MKTSLTLINSPQEDDQNSVSTSASAPKLVRFYFWMTFSLGEFNYFTFGSNLVSGENAYIVSAKAKIFNYTPIYAYVKVRVNSINAPHFRALFL